MHTWDILVRYRVYVGHLFWIGKNFTFIMSHYVIPEKIKILKDSFST